MEPSEGPTEPALSVSIRSPPRRVRPSAGKPRAGMAEPLFSGLQLQLNEISEVFMHIPPGDAPVSGFPHIVLKPARLLTAADDVDRITQHHRSMP